MRLAAAPAAPAATTRLFQPRVVKRAPAGRKRPKLVTERESPRESPAAHDTTLSAAKESAPAAAANNNNDNDTVPPPPSEMCVAAALASAALDNDAFRALFAKGRAA